MDNIGEGVEQFVHYREVVYSLGCPLSEVPLLYVKLSRETTGTFHKFVGFLLIRCS